jgi:hypothetical protein
MNIAIVLLTQQSLNALGFIITSPSIKYQTSSPYQFVVTTNPIRVRFNTELHFSNIDPTRNDDNSQLIQKPCSTIDGYISDEEEIKLKQRLIDAGFEYISPLDKDTYLQTSNQIYSYRYIKASGMLKLIEDDVDSNRNNGAPRWIPVQKGEEVSNVI